MWDEVHAGTHPEGQAIKLPWGTGARFPTAAQVESAWPQGTFMVPASHLPSSLHVQL